MRPLQIPSDTSHFLHMCNRQIKNSYKQTMRKTKDELVAYTTLDPSSVRVGLMLREIS